VATVSKSQLVSRVSEETGLAKRDVAVIVDEFLEEIGEAINQGNRVSLAGWLSFGFGKSAAIKKGTQVRNPFTGETGPHPGKRAALRIRVRPGKKLKAFVPSATSKVGKELMNG
jgi:nucleoid DNA-binding protein